MRANACGGGAPAGLALVETMAPPNAVQSAAAGAWAVRVHEVAASRDAVHVAAAWTAGRAPEGNQRR